MAALTIQNTQYILLPLSLPEDASKMLYLHYQVYTSDPLYTSKDFPSISDFIKSRLEDTIAKFSSSRSIYLKLCPASEPSTIASYVWFKPPALEKDTRTSEERDKDLREEISKSQSGMDHEVIWQIKTEEREMNLQLLGEGYENFYWELSSLVTDQNFQRKGLGTALVTEGLKEIEKSIGEEEGSKLKGVYLLASPQGARTYEKAGFVKLGGKQVKGIADDYAHLWFVKRFE